MINNALSGTIFLIKNSLNNQEKKEIFLFFSKKLVSWREFSWGGHWMEVKLVLSLWEYISFHEKMIIQEGGCTWRFHCILFCLFTINFMCRNQHVVFVLLFMGISVDCALYIVLCKLVWYFSIRRTPVYIHICIYMHTYVYIHV